MLKLTLITVGHIKEKYFKDASSEYEKRLSAFCKLNIIELEPERLPEAPSDALIEKALDFEAEKILSKVPDGSFLIPLCIEGKELDSVELSKKLSAAALNGESSICFVIGGSYGLSDKVKQRADLKLSMSKMTFPHRLARIMLLEQIYRAFKIDRGGTYHK